VVDPNQEKQKRENQEKIRNLELEQEKIEVLRKTIKTRKQKIGEDKITLKNISRIYNETRIINNRSNTIFYSQYIFRWKISSIYETMEEILSNSPICICGIMCLSNAKKKSTTGP
jgi:hypothetical protein